MAEVQKYFNSFHNKIRLTDENEVLREKRDIVLDKLRSGIDKIFDDKEKKAPSYQSFNKGSYAMGTGVVPLDGDYDIDVGLLFDVNKDDYPDPVVVKKWVYDALDGHTDEVLIMQPCVRVQYHLGDESAYHVDLAVYAHEGDIDGDMFLSRGKPNSVPERKIWQLDDPKGLSEVLRIRFTETRERKQFRRIIRYLKRWKDVKFPSDGNAAPIGIGITIAAYHWFIPQHILVDSVKNKYKANDLTGLRLLTREMLQRFSLVYREGELAERLAVELPVQPYNDLFEKMTNLQMAEFKQKLETLLDVLEEVDVREVDPKVACESLQLQLGDDFPVPDIEDTAQRRRPAIVSSSASA
jgi:hypothetical protein